MPAPAAMASVDVPARPPRANSATATSRIAARRCSAVMRRFGTGTVRMKLVMTHNFVKGRARRALARYAAAARARFAA